MKAQIWQLKDNRNSRVYITILIVDWEIFKLTFFMIVLINFCVAEASKVTINVQIIIF